MSLWAMYGFNIALNLLGFSSGSICVVRSNRFDSLDHG
ncbi:MAG: hypothetical protein RL062_681, partial [Bacteroidota bacterium]